jgi:hypothetical protein
MRRRKTLIISLNQDERIIEGRENLKRYIIDFYKTLFGKPDVTNIYFNDVGIGRLSDEDCELLKKDFTLEELKFVVFEMASNKAAGPDEFNAKFYQKSWELAKHDLFGLLTDFQKGELDIDVLNYGVITLVPKGNDVGRIQKYMPICLLNVSLKS